MNTTAFYANLNDPTFTWNLPALTCEQRRVLSRRADSAAAIGGMLETLTTGYAEWVASKQPDPALAAKRSEAAKKAAVTRAHNKEQKDKAIRLTEEREKRNRDALHKAITGK